MNKEETLKTNQEKDSNKKKKKFLSIKYKLVILMSVLLVMSMILVGFFLISQKSRELREDIWKNAMQFSELATKPLVDSYELYYKSAKNSLFFQRDLENIFSLNKDISRIRIGNFKGQILFDSKNPDQGIVNAGPNTKKLLQDVKMAIITDQRTLYVIKDKQGKIIYVDDQEKPVDPIKSNEYVWEIYFPNDDNQHRLIYSVSYAFLSERIADAVKTIVLLLVFIAAVAMTVAYIFARKIVIPLIDLTTGVKKIHEGDLTARVKIDSNDETQLLGDSFNKMAKDLEKSVETKVAHESMLKELVLAKKIQLGQLPKKTPDMLGIETSVSLESAEEIGGDVYDFLKLPDGNYFFYIGDATGHGVPASLVVALASACLYGGASQNSEPKEIMDRANVIIHAKTDANMFLTCVGFHWNVNTQKMQFVQAGHDEVFLYRKKTKKLEVLEAGGLALGVMGDISGLTKAIGIEWESGDILFAYTDGFPEAYQNEKEQLEIEPFKNIILKHATKESLEDIKKAIIKEVRDYMGDWPQNDDMTMLIVRKK